MKTVNEVKGDTIVKAASGF